MFIVPMDILGIFAEFFGNIFNVIIVLIFLIVGVVVGILLKPWFGNQVIKLIPREHRFVDLDVDEESACSITCKNRKGMPPQKFYKHKAGYTGTVGTILKKPITRFFGKEGTAYTWSVGTDTTQQTKIPLSETVKHLWGDEFYKQVPQQQKDILESSKIDVIVDIDDGLTPAEFRSVSEEDIKREEDREAAKTFWKGKTINERSQFISLLITGIAGFGIACALEIVGILRISSPAPTTIITPTPSPSTNSTATTSLTMIVTALQFLLGV